MSDDSDVPAGDAIEPAEPPAGRPDEVVAEASASSAARAASRARRIGGFARPRPAASGQAAPGKDVPRPAPRPSVAGRPGAPGEPDDPERAGMGARAAARAAARQVEVADSETTRPRPRRPIRRARPWLRWLPAVAAGVSGITVLALCVVLSHGVWWGNSARDQLVSERGKVLAAAKSCIATMNTYDYRKLDLNERAGLACTTGALTDQYRQVFEKTIKPQAATVQFTQTAQVNEAGLQSVSADGDQWVILVFGQLAVSNSATGAGSPATGAPSGSAAPSPSPSGTTAPPGPRLDPFSAQVTMQKVHDKWLVSAYNYAPSS